MYNSQSENSDGKFQNLLYCIQSTSQWLKFARFRSISYGFWNNGKCDIFKVMWPWGSCDLNIENFNIGYFVCSYPARVNKLLHFTLSLTVPETTANLYKCSKLDLSWPISQTWIVAQDHLKIGIIYILMSTDLQNFMKFCELVFEFSRSQVISAELRTTNSSFYYVNGREKQRIW